jgi:hypothetical protein
MPIQEAKLPRWRQRLPVSTQINTLIEEARMVIGYYFRSPAVKSHVVVQRELKQLAKGLDRVAKAINVLGPHALVSIHAAAGLVGDETVLEKSLHAGQLLLLARWAKEAAVIVPQKRPENEKPKPGPTGDIRLQRTVWVLAWLFENRLGVNATFWTNIDDQDSMFKDFLKSAFSDFKPSAVRFSWRQLDTAAQVAIRELKFDRPRLS